MSSWSKRSPTARSPLGSALGVSRQPISHALQLLKQQKLVEENGRRGLIVSGIDAERIRELYQVRTALDALAARLAAERIAGRVTASQRRGAAQRALAAGLALRPDAPVLAFIQADVAFHTALLSPVRQPRDRRHRRRAMAASETVDGGCARRSRAAPAGLGRAPGDPRPRSRRRCRRRRASGPRPYRPRRPRNRAPAQPIV